MEIFHRKSIKSQARVLTFYAFVCKCCFVRAAVCTAGAHRQADVLVWKYKGVHFNFKSFMMTECHL